MLSIAKIGAGKEALGYSQYQENELIKNREDYYASEQDKGQWIGGLAKGLGLAGELEKGQLLKMLQGFHPGTGEALAKNAGEKHKAGWDLCFSAPKSVSALWAVAIPETREAIEKAQARATEQALRFLEERAFSSRDRKTKTEVKNVLAATYQHGTSREKEPQLHTHVAVANMGLRPDGSVCAIEFDLRWKMAAGAVYRAELAAEMQNLGLAVERKNDSFRVAGIPEDLCKHWSTRAAQIKEQLESKGFESAKAAEVAALHTRKGKEITPRSELFAKWADEAAALGFTPEIIERLRAEVAQEESMLAPVAPADQAEPVAEEIDPLSTEALLAGLTEHDSTFTEHKIFQIVATAAQCRLNTEGIEKRVAELMQEQDLLKLIKIQEEQEEKAGDQRDPRANEFRYTTREMWQIESELKERALAMASDQTMCVASEKTKAAIAQYEQSMTLKLEKEFKLSPEQRRAALHVASETGQISLVRGDAGAGKTTMLEAAKIAWEGEGYRVHGAALAGKAAAGMEKVGIRSQTIAKLLAADADLARAEEWHAKMQEAHTKMREVVDKINPEKRSQKVLEWERSATGRLAKAEESRQQAQDALLRMGDVLIIDEAGMVGSREMSKLASLCAARGVKLVLVGDEKQLQAISAGGAFKMLQKTIKKVAQLLENRRQSDLADRQAASDQAEGKGKDVLQNYLQRDRLKVAETKEQSIANLVQDWRADQRAAKDKLILTATRADARLLNDSIRNERLESAQLRNNQALETADGKREFAEGDRLIFLKNDRNLGIKNGHIGDVRRIEINPEGMKVTVHVQDIGQDVSFLVGDRNDKALTDKGAKQDLAVYNNFDHGYAVTTHKSQGVTVAAAYILGLGDREMAYVQLTRHKDECYVYIDAKALEKAVEEAEADAADLEATSGMIGYMESFAEKHGLDVVPEDERTFRTVREWLDSNTDKALGFGNDRQKEDAPLAEALTRLKEACSAISASHQKDTTQDYMIDQAVLRMNLEQRIRECTTPEELRSLTTQTGFLEHQAALAGVIAEVEKEIEDGDGNPSGDTTPDQSGKTSPQQQQYQATQKLVELQQETGQKIQAAENTVKKAEATERIAKAMAQGKMPDPADVQAQEMSIETPGSGGGLDAGNKPKNELAAALEVPM